MKIAALVDLSEICKKAVEFGGLMASKSNSQLVLIHVLDSDASETEAQESLKELSHFSGDGVDVKIHVASGNFFSMIPTVIQDLGIDFVVVPTHGKVGLIQNLFGANILKLIKTLPVPSLVVQEGSKVSANPLGNILFPVGPHKDFDVKINQTALLAKVFASRVIIYTVRNDIRGISESLRTNIDAAKSHFDEHGVKHEVVSEEPSNFSIGYAKHILSYAEKSAVDAISVMAQVSDDNGYIGNSDKENILLNAQHLPVLCANS